MKVTTLFSSAPRRSSCDSRRRRSGPRADRLREWPESGSPPATGCSSSEPSTPMPTRSSSPPRGPRPPSPGPSRVPSRSTPYAEYPREGTRHRRGSGPPLPQGRGHPGPRLGGRDARRAPVAPMASPSTCRPRPADGTDREPRARRSSGPSRDRCGHDHHRRRRRPRRGLGRHRLPDPPRVGAGRPTNRREGPGAAVGDVRSVASTHARCRWRRVGPMSWPSSRR